MSINPAGNCLCQSDFDGAEEHRLITGFTLGAAAAACADPARSAEGPAGVDAGGEDSERSRRRRVHKVGEAEAFADPLPQHRHSPSVLHNYVITLAVRIVELRRNPYGQPVLNSEFIKQPEGVFLQRSILLHPPGRKEHSPIEIVKHF